MVTNKDRNQQQIFDPWQNMGDKRRNLLDQSWAGLFREELLGQLPTQELAVHFSSDFGRPGKDLATCLGVALF